MVQSGLFSHPWLVWIQKCTFVSSKVHQNKDLLLGSMIRVARGKIVLDVWVMKNIDVNF